MAYKYKPIKWNTKKSKVYDDDCDGNKSKYLGVYENENSLIGRNNDMTYRINKITKYNEFVGLWNLEIDFRSRNDLKKHYNTYSLKFEFTTIDKCKEKAEELNKEWNNYL